MPAWEGADPKNGSSTLRAAGRGTAATQDTCEDFQAWHYDTSCTRWLPTADADARRTHYRRPAEAVRARLLGGIVAKAPAIRLAFSLESPSAPVRIDGCEFTQRSRGYSNLIMYPDNELVYLEHLDYHMYARDTC